VHTGQPSPPAGAPTAAGKTSSGHRLWLVALASALVGALVAAGVTAIALDASDDDTGTAATNGRPVVLTEGALDVQTILDGVQESVVTIETSGVARGEVFDGAGTGVILSADGLVLTNAHVIEQTQGIRVRTFDGATFDASLVGSEPASDLAVIHIEGVDDLAPATLGTSGDLVVGEPVIAIGNALNLGGQPSVTTGIVSAVNRNIEGPQGRLSDLVQTDAAINPGNSGGPLVDATGSVVGINTAIIADSQNIGFAIAIDSAKPIIDRIQQGGGEITPDTPRLGVTTVSLDTVEPAVKDRLGIEAEHGAFVYDVIPGSGAEAAGIQQGDVIVAVDGDPITVNDDLGAAIGRHEPGDTIEVTIERDGEEQTLEAEIGRQGP